MTFWKKITHSLVFISVSARTSPKAQRPPQSSRTARTPNSHTQPTGRKSSQIISPAVKKKTLLTDFLLFVLVATRSPKSGSSQDTPYLDTSSVNLPVQRSSGPAPLFPVDGNALTSKPLRTVLFFFSPHTFLGYHTAVNNTRLMVV